MEITNPSDLQYLFHYTSVDSLAMILKNKTLRLNSLCNMDDLQEQSTNDIQNYGKFVLVSSWTEDSDEQIPMWKMYTPAKKGVRIQMECNPFIEYVPSSTEFEKTLNISVNQTVDRMIGFTAIVPPSEIYNENYFIVNPTPGKQLVKVVYTDDSALLYPNVFNESNGNINIDLGKVGVYKNRYWAFQNEWRYRLMIYPFSTAKLIEDEQKRKRDEQFRIIKAMQAGIASLPFDHYYLKIKESCFKTMKVMLAPDISESAKMFVELLVKEYNPFCQIERSQLTDLIQ